MFFLLISTPAFSELLLVAVAIAIIVFWVTCIIDVARSSFDSSSTKIVWMLVVIFLGILGAAIYQIAGKPSRRSMD